MRRSLLCSVFAFASLAAGFAHAGGSGIAVNRTAILFAPGSEAQSFAISDSGEDTVKVQIRLFRWHNKGTEDVYEQTQDIGFSPALVSLAPNESQVVRMVVLTPRLAQEGSYRLFIDQLPPPPRAGSVTLPVRFVVPVFVQGEHPSSKPVLAWKATAQSGEAVVTATNTGGMHARLADLGYVAGGHEQIVVPGLAGYVLAGEQRSWVFPYRGSSLEIVAQSEQGPIHQSIPLVAP
jgi:fimbrial chaperone protein